MGDPIAGSSYNEYYSSLPAGVSSATSTIDGHTISFNADILDYREQLSAALGAPYNLTVLEDQAENEVQTDNYNSDGVYTGFTRTVLVLRDEAINYGFGIPGSITTESFNEDSTAGYVYSGGVFELDTVVCPFAGGQYGACTNQSELAFFGNTVPESSTWGMMLAGFGGLGLAGWRGARRRAAVTIR